jgi:osmoprotectant transport system ATP-binding protein
MLELQNISKNFEGRPVLADVSLSVPKGATHALIGSSGSGKTTLLRITLGLIPFDQGYVKINDQALLSFTQVEWADRIGYVPQDGGLFPHISALNNVALIAKMRGWPKSKIDARVEELRRDERRAETASGHHARGHDGSGGDAARRTHGGVGPAHTADFAEGVEIHIPKAGENRAAGHARSGRGGLSRGADHDAARRKSAADRELP